MKKVSGIDEAGRGSVFGSLFIVGVTLDHESVDQLVKKGLKDSKLFFGLQGQKKRAELALKIKEVALELKVKEIPATEIDQTLYNRPQDNLNYLEIRNIGKIVANLSSEEIIIDSISTPQYFIKHLIGYLNKMKKSFTINIELMESNIGSFRIKNTNSNIKRVKVLEKADRIFPIVSAASCVAKYKRDKHLREIEEKWEISPKSLGQGYPNKKDDNVMKFLQQHHEDIKNHRYPFIRYSWSWQPLQQIIKPHSTTLKKFFD
ncbi:MAG: hypothetical protein ACFFAE_04195 [Candidatus Hodarchaeota archaeon]